MQYYALIVLQVPIIVYILCIHTNLLIYQRFRRQIFVTPKSFLSFVDGYKVLYKANIKEIEKMKDQRIMGLSKLADASIQVERLKKELVKKDEEILIATAASTEVKIY